MKNTILLAAFLMSLFLSAQVGIGTTNPNAEAALEIDSPSNNQGLLLPRVELVRTNSPSPFSTDIEGMFVYNTITNEPSGFSPGRWVYPGLYYNNGTDWVRALNDNFYTANGSISGSRNIDFTGSNPGIRMNFESSNRRAITLRRSSGSLQLGITFQNSGGGRAAQVWIPSSESGLAFGAQGTSASDRLVQMYLSNSGNMTMNSDGTILEGTSLLHIKENDTTKDPVRYEGVREFADNAAALAAGLPIGTVYRTGDLLKIVH